MNTTTGQPGIFKIVKRESVQDGIERITYKCGHVALSYMQDKERMLRDACSVFSVSEPELVRTAERFFSEWKAQRKRVEALEDSLVREEARQLIEGCKGRPVMKMLDLDVSALRKLALIEAESDRAAVCLINKPGNIVCGAGKDSGASAKAMLDKVISTLGGSGGGSDRIAQGKAERPGVIEL